MFQSNFTTLINLYSKQKYNWQNQIAFRTGEVKSF